MRIGNIYLYLVLITTIANIIVRATGWHPCGSAASSPALA
jgi:hypothetical protein